MTFHGQVHDQRDAVGQAGTGRGRYPDVVRRSAKRARDLNRKVTERGVAAIRQDARESLDYTVRTYYTKGGITYVQRTTTLPDGVRVRGSHCVTIGEAGEVRITFYPAGKGGEEGGDGACGRGGRAQLQLVGIG